MRNLGSEDKIARLRGSEWLTIDLPPKMLEERLFPGALYVDAAQERVWGGTDDGGVWTWSPDEGWVEHRLMADAAVGSVGAFYLDAAGRMWVGTEIGLFSQGAEEWNYHGSPWDHENWILSIVVDRDGRVWIGGTGGIAMLTADGEDWIYFEKRIKELAPGWVNSIQSDAEGSLWFSGIGGVSQFVPAGWFDDE